MPTILRNAEAHATIEEADALLAHAAEWSALESRNVLAVRIPKGAGEEEEGLRISPEDGDRIVILVEPGASARIVELGEGAFSVDIVLREDARLTYCSWGEATRARRFALLLADAAVSWLDASHGGCGIDVTSCLSGKGSDARYMSVFLGAGSERYDVRSRMIHLGDKSTSNMLTRAVMLGASSGVYEGLIRIDERARGCDAYQKQETLLLSDDARMDATPNLEIRNEDVRCSHGVSLGQLDEEKVFYFLARGIPRVHAMRLIVEGFFADVLAAMGAQGEEARGVLLSRLEGSA